jgi:hypothetical protein
MWGWHANDGGAGRCPGGCRGKIVGRRGRGQRRRLVLVDADRNCINCSLPTSLPPPPPTHTMQVMLQLNEQGLNVALYWKNRDPRTFINIVPTSAITGEGAPPAARRASRCRCRAALTWPSVQSHSSAVPLVRTPEHLRIWITCPCSCPCAPPVCPAGIPDLLQLVVKLTQSLMAERLMFVNNLEVGGEWGAVWWFGGGREVASRVAGRQGVRQPRCSTTASSLIMAVE